MNEAQFAPTNAGDAAPKPSPAQTPHAARITYLDGWRGISILLVLIGHYFYSGDRLALVGVAMFFALSGRLMAGILFVEAFPLGKFYRRRISRIYPGLLAFVLLAYWLLRSTSLTFKPLAGVLGLSFLLNYGMAFSHGVAAIENLWSLCIEEHSYILLGLAALILRRRNADPRPVLFGVAALSLLDGLVSVMVFHQSGDAIFWRTDAQLAPIFLAAALYLHFRARPLPSFVPLAALAIGAAAELWDPFLGYMACPCLFSLAIARLEDIPEPLLRMLGSPLLAAFGLWSYSLYLWQQPFYRFVVNGQLGAIAALGLAMSAGLISFYVAEQPARRWLNANWGKKRPAYAPRYGSMEGPARDTGSDLVTALSPENSRQAAN